MSDKIWNGIRLEGDINEISKLKQFIRGYDSAFGGILLVDFRKIIPIPIEFELGPVSSQEQIERHTKWCYDNWKCKWNAGFSKYRGDNKIFFETVNGSGFIPIRQLSAKFSRIKIYHFADSNEEIYCCSILDGKVIKSNFKLEDQSDYRYESDYENDFFMKFYAECGLELEYVPGEDPDIQENYEYFCNPYDDMEEDLDIDPYKLSDTNREIENIINRK